MEVSLILITVIAACDAASGPHLILIGVLIAGRAARADRPVGADRRGQRLRPGARVLLGVPDQIFATLTQYALLTAVATVGTAATIAPRSSGVRTSEPGHRTSPAAKLKRDTR